MRSKVAVAAALACLLACALPQGAGAAPANFAGASSDGKVVYFTTNEKLVLGDTDGKLDVYERSFDPIVGSYVTRVVSTGPVGGNDAFDAFFGGASADGSKAFFSTEERLVSGDLDRAEDVYRRDIETGVTVLVTVGAASCVPTCGNGNSGAVFFDASADGSRVDFVTAERLATADTDIAADVYERNLSTGATALVSRGGEACAPVCGNGSNDALFQGASADGAKVYFATTESLDPEDSDELGDLYERDLGAETTSLISRSGPGACPVAVDCTPAFGGATADGSHVFFETNERISGGDSDSASDIYDWSGGTASLVSLGPAGGNGTANATYEGNGAGGAAVFFETAESLVPADIDSSRDVYMRADAATTLVSVGPDGGDVDLPATFAKVSADGTTVLFNTAEALISGDEDTQVDVYSRFGGDTTLVSAGEVAGDGPFDASFAGASADAARAYFETSEPLAEEDADTHPDIYLRAEGATELVSTGPIGQSGSFSPNLSDVSADGSHAIFITEERLTEGDLDTERDVYDRAPAGTLLVSVGNLLQLGPPTPALTGTNPASPNPSTKPSVLGQAEAGTSIKIYYTPDCSGVPVGTGSAGELSGAGIPVAVEAETTTVMRATATDANGDTSACSSSSVSYRQAPEPPPGGEGGGGNPGGGDPGGGSTGGGPGSTGGKRPGGGGGKGGDGNGGGRQAVTPRTKVTFAPLFKTRSRRPTIGFADATEQEGTVFFCREDKKRWRSCRSPVRLKKLSYGRHVFRVKGFNSGLWEAKPALRRFQVVRR
jgi:hypothetical protein